MFRLKSLLVALIFAFTAAHANAYTLGYVDYVKIEQNYGFAKNAYNQVDDMALEIQKYMVDKEKEFKKLTSSLAKKEFEDKVQKEFKAKEEAYAKFKLKKQKEVYDNILTAIKAVAVENKIDSIVDYRVIYTGGTDLTDKVIKKLNSK